MFYVCIQIIMIKARIRWCTCRVENILTLGNVGMSLLRTTTSNMETEAEPQAVARAVLLEEPGQSQNCGEQNNAIYGNIM